MEPKYHMTQEENIFLAKRNIVDYIWKSANLEGIGVTYPDTQAIYNGMSVSGYMIEEINTVNDLKHGWSYLLEHVNDVLDLEFVKTVHRLIGKFTVINAGSIRIDDVSIGGTNWIPDIPNEKIIQDNIKKINDSDESPMNKALDMMLYVMRTQMFYDGNKRIGMLIGNKIMIQNGIGIISVKQKDIQGFYQLLIPFYETGNGAGLKQFLYENCIDGMTFSKANKNNDGMRKDYVFSNAVKNPYNA
jgi:Fic family protein